MNKIKKKVKFIPENYQPKCEIIEDVDNDISKYIMEELSINQDVYITSCNIVDEICSIFKNRKNENENNFVTDGVRSKKFNISYKLKNMNIRISVLIYNFFNKEIFDKEKNNLDLSSRSVNFGKKEGIIELCGYSISGTLNKNDLINSVHHEINHLFQYQEGKKSNFRECKLYFKVKYLLNSNDETKKIIANSLYYSFEDEQDAFINGMYAELKQYNERLDIDTIKENSELYQVIYKMLDTIDLIKSIDDEYIIQSFGITKKRCVSIIKNGVQRLENKIGKIITKLYGDYNIHESMIMNARF